MKKIMYNLAIVLFFFSCGPRTGVSNTPSNIDSTSLKPNLKQVRYVTNVIEVGKKIFRENCADCHCGPGWRCEPPYTGELRPIFNNLPMDSLPHFIAFVKNSSRIKKGLRTNPFFTEEYKKINYTHEFEKTLSDSLIKTVIEYLWIDYKGKT